MYDFETWEEEFMFNQHKEIPYWDLDDEYWDYEDEYDDDCSMTDWYDYQSGFWE